MKKRNEADLTKFHKPNKPIQSANVGMGNNAASALSQPQKFAGYHQKANSYSKTGTLGGAAPIEKNEKPSTPSHEEKPITNNQYKSAG